jgi:hypothetical protein
LTNGFLELINLLFGFIFGNGVSSLKPANEILVLAWYTFVTMPLFAEKPSLSEVVVLFYKTC